MMLKRFLIDIRIKKYRFLSTIHKTIGNPCIIQPTLMEGNGSICFGKDVYLGTKFSPHFYSGYIYLEARTQEANITFGNGVWTNNNLTIISLRAGVSIGEDTLIGMNVTIFDSDFHHINPKLRKNQFDIESSKVAIGRNVWIGANVSILKGVNIGDNSIIASNSVVTNNVAPNSIYGGVPAKFINTIANDK